MPEIRAYEAKTDLPKPSPLHATVNSVHDAVYLELALRKGLPIATLDERLESACRACEVSVL